MIPTTRCLAAGRERAARRGLRHQASWLHDSCRASRSGFSIDNSVRILDREAQTNLAVYISRPPIPLKKIRYEPFKGRWEEMDHVAERAPHGWRAEHELSVASDQEPVEFSPLPDSEEVDSLARKSAWARLLARVYEGDPLVCPECGSPMKCSFAVAKLPAARHRRTAVICGHPGP